MRFQPLARVSGVRSKTTLIPPPVSSMREIGRLVSKYPHAHPELFGKMKHFYTVIPKGNATKTTEGFFEWYFEKYVETNSFSPVLHFLGIMVPVGYYTAYYLGGHYHPRYEFH